MLIYRNIEYYGIQLCFRLFSIDGVSLKYNKNFIPCLQNSSVSCEDNLIAWRVNLSVYFIYQSLYFHPYSTLKPSCLYMLKDCSNRFSSYFSRRISLPCYSFYFLAWNCFIYKTMFSLHCMAYLFSQWNVLLFLIISPKNLNMLVSMSCSFIFICVCFLIFAFFCVSWSKLTNTTVSFS